MKPAFRAKFSPTSKLKATSTDCVAERGGFEPSRPFICTCFRAFTRISFLRRETLAGKTRFTEGRQRQPGGSGMALPRTGCGPRNEQCVCPPGEGAGMDEML